MKRSAAAEAFLKRRRERDAEKPVKRRSYNDTRPKFAFAQNSLSTACSESKFLEENGTVDILNLIAPPNEVDTVQELWLSNYMTDFCWINNCNRRILTEPSKLLVFSHSATGFLEMVQNMRFSQENRKQTHLIIPVLGQYGTHHSKAAIVFYESRCRVIIHTANYLEGDLQHMCEGVWYQDFPVVQNCSSSANSNFCQYLSRYFDHIVKNPDRTASHQLPPWGYCGARLARFDMSGATGHLVASVPGLHSKEDTDCWGHMRLRQMLEQHIKEESKTVQQDWPLVAQFTSVGSQKNNWAFEELVPSMCLDALPRVHFVVPTREEVVHGVMGASAGNSIPISPHHMFTRDPGNQGGDARGQNRWDRTANKSSGSIAAPFASAERIRLCKFSDNSPISSRMGYMPHIKTYCRFNPEKPEELSWVLLSSANLSKAAWGYFTSKKKDKLKILSYELGVLMVSSSEQQLKVHNDAKAPGSAQSNASQQSLFVPLPYSIPPVPYSNDTVPWTVDW